jgi:hypothetical protein
MNSEMEELLRAASYATANGGSVNALRVTAPADGGSPAQVGQGNAGSPAGSQADGGLAALATEVNRLLEATRAAAATNVLPPKATSTTSGGEESSAGETILRTAAMMTGVGPIVTGLMKLFGSSDSEPLPALEKFQAPAAVSVEAGLSGSREIGALRYAQGGIADMGSGNKAGAPQTQTIQVNIQAMDSQSFLDRQDDIARAVREAMLHSNSLNDVVLEL